jgi:hypothetical protein
MRTCHRACGYDAPIHSFIKETFVHRFMWFLGLCLALISLALISFDSYAIDTVQVDALVSGDGASGDLLGWSVDVDGDTAIVGANHDDGANGGVYIFVRTPGTNSWSQQAKLQEATGAGEFGFSVAIDGDTVVVGAYVKGTGEAYVHTRAGTSWSAGTPLASLTGNACQFCQQFGRSVAVSGTTIVVGSMFDGGSLNGPAAGVAYVFESNGSGGWMPGNTATIVNGKGTLKEGMLIASLPGSFGLIEADGAANDAFGSAVAIDGDTIIVGAENADSTNATGIFEKGNGTVQGNGTGAAYLFEHAGLEWVIREKVNPGLPPGSTSKFGHSVDIDGNRAVVGAFVEGTGTNAPGAVYSFSRIVQGSTWSLSEKLEPTTSAAGFAGTSVAINGTNVLVGAPGTNTAYLYDDVTTEAPGSELNAGGTISFGQSVAISLDSNSRPSFLVGAPSPGVGSAFIFLDVVIFADGGE